MKEDRENDRREIDMNERERTTEEERVNDKNERAQKRRE